MAIVIMGIEESSDWVGQEDVGEILLEESDSSLNTKNRAGERQTVVVDTRRAVRVTERVAALAKSR